MAIGPLKMCSQCNRKLPTSSFYKSGWHADGFYPSCKECRRVAEKARRAGLSREQLDDVNARQNAWLRNNPERAMLLRSRKHARAKGVPHNIDLTDISIPSHCPLLGIPLFCGEGESCDNSPSLDRKIPSLGYVKGNVWVISKRANSIKQNATVEEIEMVAKNLRLHTKKRFIIIKRRA